MDKSFCPLLEHGVQIETDRSSRVCCLSTQTLDFEKIESSENRSFDPSWIEKNCSKCISVESRGGVSMRQHMLSQYSCGFISSHASYYDLRLENTCNLLCIMCSEKYSSSWGRKLKAKIPCRRPDYLGLDLLKSKIKKHDFIHFAGGEPLLVEDHIELIRNLVSTGKSTTMKIQFTTNLTVLKNSVVELLKEFECVQFCVSIESGDSTNEIIRKPLKNSILLANIESVLKMENSRLIFQPTLSLLNIFSLHSFIPVLDKIKSQFGLEIPIVAHPLFDPMFLDIHRSPLFLKKEIDDYLQKNIMDFEKRGGQDLFSETLKGLKQTLFTFESLLSPGQIMDELLKIGRARGDLEDFRLLPVIKRLEQGREL